MTIRGEPQNHVLELKAGSRDETRALGQAVGRLAEQHLVIALVGDLGCGKTVFVKGLAQGLAVPDAYAITSPSYTLINEYPGRLPLYHADLYRLAGSIDIESTGLFEIMDSEGIVAIEWAERLAPEDFSADIRITFDITGDKTRRIALSACGQTGINLLKKLKKFKFTPHQRCGMNLNY
jgi:tRNA threonylcarbamoyladenosine biosynthesis protein TsaE